MKKSITFISLAAMAALSFTAHASLNGTGYYRINNNYTDRYIYVTDNKGSINYTTTSADMGAIELWLGIERTLYDPATVLYCQQISGKQYDIKAQGTGINQMIGFYVSLDQDPWMPDAYVAYGSAKGLTKYLFDGISSTAIDQSFLSDAGKSDCKYWKINPIDASGDNYFGVKSTITTSDGGYYAPFFAEFPFSFASSGMKACYITKVDCERGYAIYKEITGTVPGVTPLFIKCNSNNHSDNRLNIGGSATAPADNIGVGVYFNNDLANHVNHVAYNPQTMRVLGTMTDGTLALVTESYDYVPRNTFYVNVPAGAPAQLQIVSESEYNEIVASSPVDATGITLSQSSLTLTIGQTATLNANVLPAEAYDRSVTWTSSNTSVATADANGTITAIGAGTAMITATTHNGLTASCQVTVTAVNAESITLSPDYTSLNPGMTRQLTATVLPANTTDKSVTWSSADTQVVTVDTSGLVTGVGVGETFVTATTHNGHSATCRVVVIPVAASDVILNETSVTLAIDSEFTLTATVLPSNATNPAVSFYTSDPAIATVNSGGVVTAHKVGTAVIEAKCGSAMATCEVNVVKKSQTIIWNQEFGEVYVGDKVSLNAVASSGLAVRYEASENVAVEGNVLTVLAPGQVRVKARQDGDDRHEAAEPVELSFSVLAGINDAVYDSVTVQVDGAAVIVYGKPADTEVRVFSMSGLPVYIGTDSHISLQSHTAYIVVVGDRNFKIFTK